MFKLLFIGLTILPSTALANPIDVVDPILPFRRLRISNYNLSKDTIIEVDELVFDGTLVTNGHQLSIDAKRIIFHDGAGIRAFVESAPSVPVARPGPDQGGTVGTAGRLGMTGLDNEQVGEDGIRGIDGNVDPGKISIFAEEIIGIPRINGQGQSGGKGGQGGAGGAGGRGGNGANGIAKCPGRKEQGGNSGGGGRGGFGGGGGQGGRGGAPVPIKFFYVRSSAGKAPALHLVQSIPGKGGEGGDGGIGGNGGSPGLPGGGDQCWSGTKKAFPGVPGPTGPQGPNGATGPIGPDGPLSRDLTVRAVDLSELNRYRLEVIQAWESFQQTRSFFHLAADSLRVAEVSLASRNELLRAAVDPTFVLPLIPAAKQEMLKSITESWREQVLAQIDLRLKAEEISPEARSRLHSTRALSVQFLRLLTDLSERWPQNVIVFAREVFEPASHRLVADLEAALRACQDLERAKHDLSFAESGLGATRAFTFDACARGTRLRDPNNIFEAITLPGESRGQTNDSHLQSSIAEIADRKSRSSALEHRIELNIEAPDIPGPLNLDESPGAPEPPKPVEFAPFSNIDILSLFKRKR